MSDTPSYLNSFLAHTDILRLMGSSVKASIPTVTGCPVCGLGNLRIYADPRGGAWYSCRDCEFHGDSIQLYSEVAKVPVKRAIQKLIGLSVFNRDVETGSIDKYIKTLNKRLKDNKFWGTCKKNLKHKDPSNEYLDLLQRFELGIDWNPKWSNRLGQFIGGTSSDKIQRALNVDAKLRKKHFLVLPYHDVPGRACAVHLTSKTDSDFSFLYDPCDLGREEGGLFMLETTTPGLPVVYALGDPIMALYLQRKYLLDSDMPAPLVAWNDSTNVAWDAVKAQKIIFWDHQLNYRVFEQARKVDGLVADAPVLGHRSVHEYVRDTFGATSVLSEMEEHAKPWPEALRIWVLRHNPPDVAELLTRLSLTPNEKQEVLDSCTASERDRVGEYFGDARVASSITFDGAMITERNGAWKIRLGRRTEEETLSDAVIRVIKVLRHESANKNYFSGVIEYQGKSIPFTDPVDRVVNHTYHWLSDTLFKMGLGPPIIKQGWAKKLINVAQTFERPKVIPIAEKVGIEGDSFNFPLFTIMHGSFTAKPDTAFISGEMPAVNVELPRRVNADDLELSLRDDIQGMSEFWALFSCLIANTMSPNFDSYSRATRRCIGLIGEGADCARKGIELACGLARVDMSNKSWRKRMETDSKHDLPTVLHHRISAGSWKRIAIWREEGHGNIITPMPAPAGFSLSVSDPWVFVVAEKLLEDLPTVDLMQQLLPLYIARLQANDYDLPDERNVWYAILDDVRSWIKDTYPEVGDPELVLERAKTLIREGNPDGEITMSSRLLILLIYLAYNQELGISYAGYQLPEDDIVIDEENYRVRLSIDRIDKVLSKLGIPEVDWSLVEASLEQKRASEGNEVKLGRTIALYLSKDLFDTHYKKFMETSILAKKDSTTD